MALQVVCIGNDIYVKRDEEVKLVMSEEEAIQLLGKHHPVVVECRQANIQAKRKKIEELKHELKKLEESL